MISKHISFVAESTPGEKWRDFAAMTFPDYRQWYHQFNHNKVVADECMAALQTHMPEFKPVFDHMADQLELNETDRAIFSFYCPAPAQFGCSQAVWLRQYPVLVRNYDYSPRLSEGRILMSRWQGIGVLASTDCLWGALDGMNEFGLCVSVTLVGSVKYFAGFAAPVVVRYLLQYCRSVNEAVNALMRIPLCTAYNFTLVDAAFAVKTVEVNPLTGIHISSSPTATNHQSDADVFRSPWLYSSFLRKKTMQELLQSPYSTIESFIHSFGYFPLLNPDHSANTGTLYTAAYNSVLRSAEFRWPDGTYVYQSFFEFTESDFHVQYPAPGHHV